MNQARDGAKPGAKRRVGETPRRTDAAEWPRDGVSEDTTAVRPWSFILLSAAVALLGAGVAHRAYGAPFTVCCITLTPAGSFEIDLSWQGAPSDWGVTGYKIERETPVGGGFTTIVANTGSTATTYADKNLASNTIYSYRISAITSDGAGPASSILAAAGTPLAQLPIPPDRVKTVSAIAVSSSGISIAWTAPDQGGSAITGYEIDRGSSIGGGDFAVIVANSSSTGTSYSDTGLLSGVTYNYRVSAINKYGTSPNPSPTASAMTFALPSAPQNVRAAISDRQVTVNWSPPQAPGGTITGYLVSGAATGTVQVGGNATGTVIGGLVNGTSYTFSVRAVNSMGGGDSATIASVIPAAILQTEVQTSTSPAAAVPSSALQSPQSVQDQLKKLTETLRTLMASAEMQNAATSSGSKQIASPPRFQKNLSLGSSGDDVKALQVFLIRQDSGPMAKKLAAYGASGHFGFLTRNALIEYQKRVGISPAAGTFGPKTRAYLNSLRE